MQKRKIATLSVLPTLDWATEICQREEVAVVRGFHSQMEKEVLKILLLGKCGIIVVLARGMYHQVPQIYEEALQQNRLLLLSYEKGQPNPHLRTNRSQTKRAGCIAIR